MFNPLILVNTAWAYSGGGGESFSPKPPTEWHGTSSHIGVNRISFKSHFQNEARFLLCFVPCVHVVFSELLNWEYSRQSNRCIDLDFFRRNEGSI